MTTAHNDEYARRNQDRLFNHHPEWIVPIALDHLGSEALNTFAEVWQTTRENEQLRLEVTQLRARAEAAKRELAAETKRTETLADGIRAYRELVLGGDYVRCGCHAWEREHGNLVGEK